MSNTLTSANNSKNNSIYYNLATTYISAGVGAFAVYPLDTLRVRLQSSSLQNFNIRRELLFLLRNEGYNALYKGLLPKIITTGLEKTVKITTFNYTREFLMNRCNHSANNADILAGFIAGGVQSLVMSPTENLSTQMQIYRGKNHISMRTALQQIGINRLYNGWFACFARDAPFSAIYFAVMNDILRRLDKYPQFIDTSKSTKALIAGSLAAIPAAYLVTPFDVIKTRIQATGIKGYRYHFMDILDNFGVRGFFKGSMFRIARSTPQFGITMATLSLLTNF